MTTQTLRLDARPSSRAARERAMRDILLAPPAILRGPAPAGTQASRPPAPGIHLFLAAMMLMLAAAVTLAIAVPPAPSAVEFFGP